MTEDSAKSNTDTELWRERLDDFYADGIHVTRHGGIGINVGGLVIVRSLKQWHESIQEVERLKQECDINLQERQEMRSLFPACLDGQGPTLLEAMKATVDEAAKDRARIACIAGCGSDDGPLIEGLGLVLDDFWCFLGDAIRDRIGEENDDVDEEGTDEDKITAMRAMIDEAIAAEKGRRKNNA